MKTMLRNVTATLGAFAVVVVGSVAVPVFTDNAGATGEEVDEVPLDEFDIGSNWPTGANSTVPLVAGRMYRIEVTGSFSPDPAGQPGVTHDAECWSYSGGAGFRSDPEDEGGRTPDLYVNNTEVDWTATQASAVGCNDLNHTYRLLYTSANTGQVNLRVNDDALSYADNAGTLHARLFTATADDPSNPAEDVEAIADDVEGSGQQTLDTVNQTARETLAGQGIDPDDPTGSAERKGNEARDRVEAERDAAERQGAEARDDAEERVGDATRPLEGEPGKTVDTVTGLVPPIGPVDPGPVAEAVNAVLDDVEEELAKVPGPDELPEPGDEPPEPPEPVRDAVATLEGTAQDVSGQDIPNPVQVDDDPDSGTGGNTGGGNTGGGNTGGGNTGGGNTGGGASEPTSEVSTPTSDATAAGDSSPVATAANPTAAPTAEEPASPQVLGTQARRQSGATTVSGASVAPDMGLLPESFGVRGLPDFSTDSAADTEQATARRTTAKPPRSPNMLMFLLIGIAVLGGTFEMGRRALGRFQAERAYHAYRYR